MALAVGKSGCVLALEPNSYVYPVLAKNAELNPDKTHIIPLPFAATPEDAELVFQYSDAGYCNGGRFDGISRWTHGHAFELRVQGRNLLSFLQAEHPELDSENSLHQDRHGRKRRGGHSLDLRIAFAHTNRFCGSKCTGSSPRSSGCSLYRSVSSFGYTLHRIVNEDNYRGELIRESDLSRWKHFDAFCVPA